MMYCQRTRQDYVASAQNLRNTSGCVSTQCLSYRFVTTIAPYHSCHRRKRVTCESLAWEMVSCALSLSSKSWDSVCHREGKGHTVQNPSFVPLFRRPFPPTPFIAISRKPPSRLSYDGILDKALRWYKEKLVSILH